MSFEIEGKLVEKFAEVVVSEKFKKREFVIETEDNANGSVYTESIKFQLVQAKCDAIEPMQIGSQIKVHFNIKGRKWEKDGKTSYFTNLDAWRVEACSGAVNTPGVSEASKFPETESQDSGEKLPF